jgi:hypothetical protein
MKKIRTYSSNFMRALVIHFYRILEVTELPVAVEFKHIAGTDISVDDAVFVRSSKPCTHLVSAGLHTKVTQALPFSASCKIRRLSASRLTV